LPWLTGSATWFQYAALQYILGMRPVRKVLLLDPCIPTYWDEFSISREFPGHKIDIEEKIQTARIKVFIN